MSTKSTIAYGPTFHLYHEFDRDCIYLELEGTQFEAGYNRVMVPIPIHIWEFIRRYPAIEIKYADKTDAELCEYVEQEVDNRLQQYQEAHEKAKRMISLLGSLVFGTPDEPREQQIAQGMKHFSQVREQQQQIKRAIAELERENQRR